MKVSVTPRVTVGLPFRNPGKYFELALASVFSQTFTDWELLLVDDGSDDDSLTLARGVRDARGSVVADGLQVGLSARLNQIAQLARGEYLARMDADDLMHPNRLRRQVEALDADQTLDVTGTATYSLDATGVVNGVRGLARADTSPAAVVARVPFIHPTVTGRTVWFHRHPYDGRFVRAEDHELWCRTASSSRFMKINKPLYFYREGGPGALDKYIRSCRTDRSIYRLYGAEARGRIWTEWMVLLSHLKAATYSIAVLANLEAELLSLRNAELTADDRAEASCALATIRSTHVEGLDGL